MMCKKIVVAIGLLLTIQAGAQDQRQLMSIGEEKINVEEFLAIYNKNNTNNVVDKKTMEEYVDLFVNFKLKGNRGRVHGNGYGNQICKGIIRLS